jgi:Arylsulfotransferase (ASST)
MMFRKIELWVVALLCVVFSIVLIGYGALLKQELTEGKKYPFLQKTALLIAEIPENIKNLPRYFNPDLDLETKKSVNKASFADKPRFKRFIKTEREALLLLPRYDGNLKRSVVEIIDLNDFSVLHTFKPDISEINGKTDATRVEFRSLETNSNPKRYEMQHPILEDNGDLTFHGNKAPQVKIDFCGKLLWVNDDHVFHHSIEKDQEGNYWVPAKLFPYAVKKELIGEEYGNYEDDAIVQISPEGKVVYRKSVSEILIENNYKSFLFAQRTSYFHDPVHLNDIQPALQDGTYWKQGDVFLSLKKIAMILHFRPSTNKLVNVITGNFFNQHDIDIISDREISIFNNNVLHAKHNKNLITNNKILIYNFETKQFSEKFASGMKKNKIKTISQGLSDILKDGSMLVEEQNYGRILFFNSEGKLEWEFVNRADNNKMYRVKWSRIIEDKNLIKKTKLMIRDSKCSN